MVSHVLNPVHEPIPVIGALHGYGMDTAPEWLQEGLQHLELIEQLCMLDPFSLGVYNGDSHVIGMQIDTGIIVALLHLSPPHG